MSTIEIVDEKRRSHTARLLWWIFIGWWASFGWLSVAWVLIATLAGIPLGMEMLARFPDVVSLSGRASLTPVKVRGVDALAQGGPDRRRNILVRLLYFAFLGWWLGCCWIAAIWFVGGAYFPGLRLVLRMLNRIPKVVWNIE